MSSREFAVVALGRFLVVERYRETCPSPPNDRLPFPGPDRSGSARGKSHRERERANRMEAAHPERHSRLHHWTV